MKPYQKAHSRLRDAEKDLVFAIGKLQEGKRLSAYLNVAVALVHIGSELNESEHQTALVETARLVGRAEATP